MWDTERKVWKTSSLYRAAKLMDYATGYAKQVLEAANRNLRLSQTLEGDPAQVKSRKELFPFQAGAVRYMVEKLKKRRAVLLADEQGLGKTVQAIAVMNEMGVRKPVIVCPASLRYVWAEEIAQAAVGMEEPQVVLSGKDRIRGDRPTIVSYNLVSKVVPYEWGGLIIDEAHYVKSMRAKRTKLILRELANHVVRPILALSGTPAPNRPHELWPLLISVAPDVIDRLPYGRFLERYCVTRNTPFGLQVVGSKNEDELSFNLRAKGFMVRRLKRDAIPQLPDKIYKIVNLHPTGALSSLLERESAFDPQEIVLHGAPVGSALPEIRREMGVAKVPLVVEYVRDMLEEGTEKVVLFGYHREVIEQLAEQLAPYGTAKIYGSTPAKERQKIVQQFQEGAKPRIIVGQIHAAGTGLTLTRACDVVFAEPSWVPGENEQCADRVHRIGQTRGVQIHFLVVRGSIDAYVLSTAYGKKRSLDIVMGDAP